MARVGVTNMESYIRGVTSIKCWWSTRPPVSRKRVKGRRGTSRRTASQLLLKWRNPRPKPETECFYCKGTGHWKRNCPKYLAEKKDGKVKGIFDIHVIDVYLTNAHSSVWVFDTGSVAMISNSKQEYGLSEDCLRTRWRCAWEMVPKSMWSQSAHYFYIYLRD